MDFKLKKNELNFRVYTATSIPETGIENDICIISETPMKNWVLSPDAPSGAPRTDGDVRFKYSVDGATFNMLKQNTVMIRLVSAFQFVDGAWVGVNPKIYQAGVWVDWVTLTVLYDFATGDKNTALLGSGGFSVKTTQNSSYGTITETVSGFSLNSGSSSNVVFLSHENKIDLTAYKTLHVVWSGGYGSQNYGIGVYNTNKPTDTQNSIAYEAKTQSGEYEAILDISSVKEGYIVLSGFTSTIYFKKIWLDV